MSLASPKPVAITLSHCEHTTLKLIEVYIKTHLHLTPYTLIDDTHHYDKEKIQTYIQQENKKIPEVVPEGVTVHAAFVEANLGQRGDPCRFAKAIEELEKLYASLQLIVVYSQALDESASDYTTQLGALNPETRAKVVGLKTTDLSNLHSKIDPSLLIGIPRDPSVTRATSAMSIAKAKSDATKPRRSSLDVKLVAPPPIGRGRTVSADDAAMLNPGLVTPFSFLPLPPPESTPVAAAASLSPLVEIATPTSPGYSLAPVKEPEGSLCWQTRLTSDGISPQPAPEDAEPPAFSK